MLQFPANRVRLVAFGNYEPIEGVDLASKASQLLALVRPGQEGRFAETFM
jgi:hypothetical protein